jgi:MoaA/NifB/PqqE/SkfB family radical SAM enzyme
MIPEELVFRVQENLERRAKGPYCIDLIINDLCNLGCCYCSGSVNRGRKDKLPIDALIKILDSAKGLFVREISLTSLTGEPTGFKEIRCLMEEIKRRSFVGTLLTNGTLLDAGFALFVRKIQWDIMVLSLDSFTPGIQYRSRPDTLRNNYLEKIIEFLEYSARDNPQLKLDLNMVVNKFNYRDVPNYFKKAQDYGIKNITLLKLVKMNDKYEEFALDEKQTAEFRAMLKSLDSPIYFNRLEWIDEGKGMANSIQQEAVKTDDNSRRKCFFHLYKILIDCDGRILKCNGDTQKTQFCVSQNNLTQIYNDLLDAYAGLRIDPPCWDICCSPIKSLNQQIGCFLEKA